MMQYCPQCNEDTWQELFKLDEEKQPLEELVLDEDYAVNIVLGGYLEAADQQFGEAGIFEVACRPCWSRSD